MAESPTPGNAIAVALLLIGLINVAGVGCKRREKLFDRDRKVLLARPHLPVMTLSEVVREPGAEPRTALRYRAVGSRRVSIEKTSTATLSERVNGEKTSKLALPAVTTTFDVGWLSGTTGFTIDARALPARVHATAETPAQATAAADQLLFRYRKLLEGKGARIAVSLRGELGAVTQDGAVDKVSQREFLAALIDVVVVLPEAPVGAGAVWEVVRAIPRGTNSVKQVATYKLVKVAGDMLELEVETLVVGERQPIDAGKLPLGSVAELLFMRATSTGALTVDLGAPTAVAARLERKDVIHTRIGSGNQTLSDYYSESESTLVLTSK